MPCIEGPQSILVTQQLEEAGKEENYCDREMRTNPYQTSYILSCIIQGSFLPLMREPTKEVK